MKQIKNISIEVVYALIVGGLVLFSCLTEKKFETSRYGIFAFLSIITLGILALNTIRCQILLEENKITTNSTGVVAVIFFLIISALVGLIYLLSWIIKIDFWKAYMLSFSSSAVFILAKNLLKIFYSQSNLKVFYREETLLAQEDENASENVETDNETETLSESEIAKEEPVSETVLTEAEEPEAEESEVVTDTDEEPNEVKPDKKRKLVFSKKKTASTKSESPTKTKKKKNGQNAAKSIRGLFSGRVERDPYDDPELYEKLGDQLDN